ncbi:hypothetical protein PC114_g14306 [Phytophthora cactorum]|nr:hypothetical protein PC114_g14306 [Phytophthora cactorum]
MQSEVFISSVSRNTVPMCTAAAPTALGTSIADSTRGEIAESALLKPEKSSMCLGEGKLNCEWWLLSSPGSLKISEDCSHVDVTIDGDSGALEHRELE